MPDIEWEESELADLLGESSWDAAVREWRRQINDWYFGDDPATFAEVERAFHECAEDNGWYGRDRYNDGDQRHYIDIFFTDRETGGWSKWLDTDDREKLTDYISRNRAPDRRKW